MDTHHPGAARSTPGTEEQGLEPRQTFGQDRGVKGSRRLFGTVPAPLCTMAPCWVKGPGGPSRPVPFFHWPLLRREVAES